MSAPAHAEPAHVALLERDNALSLLHEARLDQPTSLEIIGNTAYVATLNGEIWRIDDVSGPPYG